MVHVGVFSANKVKSNIVKQWIKIAKYHETVNMSIAYAISRPFGGEHTTGSCMLISVATILHTTHKKCGVKKEMEGWEMGGSLELLSCVDDDVGAASLPKRGRLSTVKKNTAVQKGAMTEKRERWQNEEWYGKAKSRWQRPAGEDGGQSSQRKDKYVEQEL